MDIKEAVENLRENVKRVCLEYGGEPERVQIVPATKMVSCERIKELLCCGIGTIGENRVQELLEKYELLGGFKWHFIGALQTNKVKYIIDKVELIHSLDRLALAQEIQKQAQKKGITANVLIEINIGGEESKSGVSLNGLPKLYETVKKMPGICLKGFMSVLPKNADECLYKKMKDVFDFYSNIDGNIKILSVGMSDDYLTALKYGANLIRPGSAIFGKRNYN